MLTQPYSFLLVLWYVNIHVENENRVAIKISQIRFYKNNIRISQLLFIIAIMINIIFILINYFK